MNVKKWCANWLEQEEEEEGEESAKTIYIYTLKSSVSFWKSDSFETKKKTQVCQRNQTVQKKKIERDKPHTECWSFYSERSYAF